MPAALPFLAAGVGQALGGSAAFYYFATSVVVGAYQADRNRKALHAAQDAARRDTNGTINIRSAVSPRQLVLGTRRVFGVYAYAEFVGSNQEYFDQIIAFCNNEVSIGGVYFDDELVTVANISAQVPQTGKFANLQVVRGTDRLTVSGGLTVTLAFAPTGTPEAVAAVARDGGGGDGGVDNYLPPVTISGIVGQVVTVSGVAAGEVIDVTYNRFAAQPMKVQFATGTTSQASTTWSGVSTPKWTANHRLRGMGQVRTLMAVDDTAYANGLPQVSVLATGNMPVWDPRAGGGAGANVTGTNNPALLAAWYRTLARQDGGMGIPTTWIDWPSVAAAANICDELITAKTLSGVGTESIKRYTCDVVLSLGNSRNDNLRIILSAMAGDFPFTGGLYKCYAGAFRSSVYTITDADVVASAAIEFTPSAGGFRKPPNIMAATLADGAKNFNETGAPEVVNSTYVTNDGEEEIDDLPLPATTDSRRANYLQGVRLEQSRPAHQVRITLGGVAADWDLFTAVQFDLQGYEAFDGLTFELRRWANNFNGRYQLELVQSKATTWALDADRYTPVSVTAPPDLSYIWNVTAPSGVAVASGPTHKLTTTDGTVVARLKVSWTLHPQAYVQQSGAIVVRWRRIGVATWTEEPAIAGDATFAYLMPVIDGATYQVEVMARNASGGISAWVAAALHIASASGAYGSAALSLVAHGSAATSMVVTGVLAVKKSGTGAWDAGVHSTTSLAGACEASAVAGSATTARMLALNADPAADGNYTGLDYAIYLRDDGQIDIYENGAGVSIAITTYTASDRVSVRYTGAAIEYRKNATVLRTVKAAMNLALSLDSSFFTVGGWLEQLAFAPLTPKPVEYKVSTFGASTTPPAGVDGTLRHVDGGNESVITAVRSYLMARISRTTGLVTFSQSYDVYGDGANTSGRNAATLATDLNATDSTSAVVVWSYDEPQNLRLASGLDTAMYRCGASRQVFGDNAGFKRRGAYILVGVGGCGLGNGFEAYRGAIDEATDAWVQTAFQITPQGQLLVDGRAYTPEPQVGGGNMLRNSSFEVDADADGLADNWTLYSAGTTGTITKSIGTSNGVAGSNAQALSPAGMAVGAQVGVYQTINLEQLAGQAAVLSAYMVIGTAGMEMQLMVQFFNATPAFISQAVATFEEPSATVQRRYSLPMLIPAGTKTADVYLLMQDSPATAVRALYIDAAQFELGSLPTAYAPRADELLAGVVSTTILDPNARGVRRFVDEAGPVTVSEVTHIPDGLAFKDVLIADTQFTAAYAGKAVVTLTGSISLSASADTTEIWLGNEEGSYSAGKFFQSGPNPIASTNRRSFSTTQIFALAAASTYTFAAYASKSAGGETVSVDSMQLIVEVTYGA